MEGYSLLRGRVTGGFWGKIQKRIAKETLDQQYDILNGKRDGLKPDQYSFCIENFELAAGRKSGEYHGYVYSDSELGKWMEAAAYSLRNMPDQRLEERMDGLVDLVAEAQMEDGYVNTYFQVLRPESRLKHFAFSCELYNMGHLMEAAAAYYETTGKRKFLDVMCKTGDLLCELMKQPEYSRVYDGHPEIELGLYRLYQVTGEKRYLSLAAHFIRERGRQPCFFQSEELLGDNDEGANDKWFGADHHLAHRPVREQEKADGHAVKAMYLYSAVADMVKEGLDTDGSLERAMNRVWKNMTERRMYITGGIGSQGYAERFTVDDDLPPDRGYLETCAAVGVCFWAVRLLRLYREARYADILERALYNGVLAGWSLDGDAYFYTNPLHYKRTVSDYREDCRHLENGRQKWFRCACCPSNVLRLAADIQEYCLTVSPDEVDINLYLQGSWELETGGKRIVIESETEYPFDGKVRLHIRSDEQPFRMRLGLRIPEWCRGYELSLNGEECGEERSDRGYALMNREWDGKEEIVLTLQMPAEYVFPDPRIWDCAGKAALVRGPLVYCLESLDQEENDLTGIGYRLNAAVEQAEGEGILEGITLLKAAGCRRRGNPDGKPYTALRPAAKECEITAIPYFAWRNRGEADMDVWLPFLER